MQSFEKNYQTVVCLSQNLAAICLNCMYQLAAITHSNFRVNLNNHFRAHFFFREKKAGNTNACYNTKWKFIITYYRSSFIFCFKKKCNFPRRCHPAKIRTIFAVNLVRIEVTSPYSNKTRSINFKVIKITKWPIQYWQKLTDS